jgi:hypothetical protein
MSGQNDPADDRDAPDSALEEAFLLYRDAGLRLPPVPHELAEALGEQADWEYATAETDLTDRAAFLADAAQAAAPASVAFGHIGHGVASWYHCYRLIRGPLAVYLRQRFGSSLEVDAELGLVLVNGATTAVEDLVVSADDALANGRLRSGQRVLVVLDDQDGSGWQVLGAGGTAWEATEAPFSEALAFLHPAN